MRNLILVEDSLTRSAWRAKMLAAAQDPEAMFTAVQPAESGLDRTIYVSETSDHPTIIVDTRLGKNFAPDDNAQVLAVGEASGTSMVDRWLEMNDEALRHYIQGDYDTIDFYDAMTGLDEATRSMTRSAGLTTSWNFKDGSKGAC